MFEKLTLNDPVFNVREIYPTADVVGHNDLNLHKACPCFSAVEEYNSYE